MSFDNTNYEKYVANDVFFIQYKSENNMNNNESSIENGRYVWAAILIILAVILAAIAFVTWIVDSGNETVKGDVPSEQHSNTILESRKDTNKDSGYRNEENKQNDTISKNTDIENNSETTDNKPNNGYYTDTEVDESNNTEITDRENVA